MLRDMEAADARGELPSDDEAADWAAAEPAGGHGGRLRFGGGAPQQHHLVSMRKKPHAPVPGNIAINVAGLYSASRDCGTFDKAWPDVLKRLCVLTHKFHVCG